MTKDKEIEVLKRENTELKQKFEELKAEHQKLLAIVSNMQKKEKEEE